GDSVEDLVKALDHPAHTERLRVQRLLEETCRGRGGAKALGDAKRYLRDERVPAALRRHLLWAFANLGDLQPVPHTGRQAKEPGVLAEAVRALADFRPGSVLLGREVFAREPQVRLQVALALRTHWHGFTRDQESICDHFLDTEDAYLRYAGVTALQAQR